MAVSGTTNDPMRRERVPDCPRIYRSSSGNFEIRYSAGHDRLAHVCDGACPDGLAAAKRADAEIQQLLKDGMLTASNIRFSEVVSAWATNLERRARDDQVEGDTLRRYQRERQLLEPLLDAQPAWMTGRRHKLVRDIFPHTVAALNDRLEADGRSAGTRRVTLTVLAQILDHAVEAGWLNYNAVHLYRDRHDLRHSRHQRHRQKAQPRSPGI